MTPFETGLLALLSIMALFGITMAVRAQRRERGNDTAASVPRMSLQVSGADIYQPGGFVGTGILLAVTARNDGDIPSPLTGWELSVAPGGDVTKRHAEHIPIDEPLMITGPSGSGGKVTRAMCLDARLTNEALIPGGEMFGRVRFHLPRTERRHVLMPSTRMILTARDRTGAVASCSFTVQQLMERGRR